MTHEELERMRSWADTKLATGEEPPWAWYAYMKLREALDVILAGMAVTKPPDSPLLEQHSEKHVRLAVCNSSPETAPPHSGELPVQMPM